MSEIIIFFGDKSRNVRCPFYQGDDIQVSEENRKYIAQDLNIQKENFVIGNQRHTNTVKIITATNKTEQHEADALITTEKDVALWVITADCLPILIHDRGQNLIATIHAGWKWIKNGIIENTLQEISQSFEVSPQDLIIYIGPHISKENYEVGEEFREYFPEDRECFYNKGGNVYFSLEQKTRKVFWELGIKEKHIHVSDICTYKNSEKYFSFRKSSIIENNQLRASWNNCSYIMISSWNR